MNDTQTGRPDVVVIYLPDESSKELKKLAKFVAKKLRKETGAAVVILPRCMELDVKRL